MVERIVIHAGTPKTGTTSLQIVLERERQLLASAGICYPATDQTDYPRPDGTAGTKPKHQWLVGALMAPDSQVLVNRISASVSAAAPETTTVVFSTEGIYHHWWDFAPAGRAALVALTQCWQVEVWVWFRHPVDFFVSSYVQMLKNPRGGVACYGQDWSPEQLLVDPWFSRRLDYCGFVDQVTALLGPHSVRLFAYRGTTCTDFSAAIGFPGLGGEGVHEHRTLGATGVAMLRALNRVTLPRLAKVSAVRSITQFDHQIGPASPRFALDDGLQQRIMAQCDEGLRRLHDVYGFELIDAP